MATGTVYQKLRPLRFAFLVDPANRKALLQAIQLSSMQWGGTFNPIIPVYKNRLPRRWSRYPYLRRQKPKSIVEGYLEAFDPDCIVPVGVQIDGQFNTGNAAVTTPDDLVGDFSQDGHPGYGIGMFELCAHVAETEFKFVRKSPLNVVFPKFAKSHELFLSAVFGALPSDVEALIKMHLGERLGITKPSCSVATFSDFLGPNYLFVRRIGVREIDYHPREAIVYCMDATSPLDVIDYWNLRAAGFYVIPAPKQEFDNPKLHELVKSFVEENYVPQRHNPDYYFRSTFQVGRSIEMDDVQEFANKLNIPQSEKKTEPKFLIRHWYPRLWDRWARLETDEHVHVFYSKEKDISIKNESDAFDLRAMSPAFDQPPIWRQHARFANVITYRLYGVEEAVAEVLPAGSANLARSFARASLRDFRLSRAGPVFLADRDHAPIFFNIPSAEEFMLQWLAEEGWTVTGLSQAGRIANQMLRKLGGLFGVHVIDNEDVIKLIDRHASEKADPSDPRKPRTPKWIVESALNAEIDRVAQRENQKGHGFNRERYLSLLRERDVFRLGLQLHCPTCTRWLWKAIGDLTDEIECDHCLTNFSVSSAPEADRQWSFKPVGPFNVRGFAGGAYPVLLTWKFFCGIHDRTTTPLLSFELEKAGFPKSEIDLAMFCSDGRWNTPKIELLLVECKAYDSFKKSDVEKMRLLGEQFPEAILVFAKFSGTLTTAESKLIGALAKRHRKLWKAQKPHNGVMILTGNELFSDRGAPECWKDKDGLFDQAYKRWHSIQSLRTLAEATQFLYLGLPTLHDWIEAERKKRKRPTTTVADNR